MLYFYVSPTLAILTILLNSALFYTLIKQYRCNKRGSEQKHSIPLIFLANLAISDLLVGLTLVIIKVICYLIHYRVIQWSASLYWGFHVMQYAFLRLSLLTSVFNLASLTVDRFLAIRYPMAYRMKVSNKKAFAVVGITWLLSTIFTAATYGISYFSDIVSSNHSLVIFPAVVFPAALLFAICYSLVLHAIRKQGRKMRLMVTGGCTADTKSGSAGNLQVGTGNCDKGGISGSREIKNGIHKDCGVLTDISGGNGKYMRSISVLASSEIGKNSKYTNVRIIGCKISELKGSGNLPNTGIGKKSLRSHLGTENVRSSVPLHIQKREIKIYRFVGTVVGVFLLCWLPIAICAVILMKRPLNTFLGSSTFTFAFANSVIDPILYFVFNNKVSDKARRLFRLIFRCACVREEERLRSTDILFGPSLEVHNSVLSKTRSTASSDSTDAVL